ncbi:uncharacterized protein TNCV_3030461 [Trichonephila clavipes]|nr:uncharacterized protein TNCV_3030461 [Trichonephila clavipes]
MQACNHMHVLCHILGTECHFVVWSSMLAVVSILGRSVLAVYDAGDVAQLYPLRAQWETDLMISQSKVTCQHSVEPIALLQRCEESIIVLENSSLNAVYEWQYYRLNYQTDVKICNQCIWDNLEGAPAVTRNCPPENDSSCRSNVSRPQTDWLQAFP